MDVIIRTLDNENYSIKFSSDENLTVSDLKDRIVQLKGFTREYIKLVFKGKILSDQAAFKEAGIVNGAQLVIVVKKPKEASQPLEDARPVEDVQQVDDSSDDVLPDDEPEGIPASFQQLLQNPVELLREMMNVNPMVQNNRNQVENMLNNPEFVTSVANMTQQMMNNFQQQLTQEEEADIRTLVEMGTDRITAITYYRQCNNDIQLAASIILDDQQYED